MNLSILFHKTNSLIFSKKKKRTAKIKIDNVSDFRKLKYGIMQTKKKRIWGGSYFICNSISNLNTST